jgi:hypothetical protein
VRSKSQDYLRQAKFFLQPFYATVSGVRNMLE